MSSILKRNSSDILGFNIHFSQPLNKPNSSSDRSPNISIIFTNLSFNCSESIFWSNKNTTVILFGKIFNYLSLINLYHHT